MTQTSGPLKPFAKVLGLMFEYIYRFFAHFGIENVGIVIIVFVLIVKLCMFPMTIKQQKFSKMNTIMQPELEAIRKKYEGKKDNESMAAMNNETSEVYKKYGVSPTGGCLNMLIQIPIMFALYRVVMNIPAYVPQIKIHYTNIINSIGASNLLNNSVVKDVANSNHLSLEKLSGNTEISNRIVDVLYKFNSDNWKSLKGAFDGSADIITKNVHSIDKANSFLGMNLTQSPKYLVGNHVYIAILIPILAALTQFISSKMSMADTQGKDDGSDNPMAASLKSMTYTMPLLSLWMCYSFATCIGIYWIVSSVFQMFSTIIVNKYFEKTPIEKLVQESQERAQKRRESLGIDDESIKKAASINSKKINSFEQKAQEAKDNYEKLQAEKNNTPKKGSIADKANLVDKYK